MKSSRGREWEDSRVYYQYIKDIIKYPLLTKQEEKAVLLEVQNGNKAAIHKLVCANLKFVINVAYMYKGQGFTLPELINEGNIGLIESAKRFDLNKKIRFISYAVWWIRQSITRSIAEKARLVRISAEKELVLKRINRNAKKLTQTIGGGHRIDTFELAKTVGYSEKAIEKILEMGQIHNSLNDILEKNSNTSLMDVIPDETTEPSDILATLNSRNEYLEQIILNLSSQEQKVIKLYFGIGYQKNYSLEEIGELINLSKERVRQIKERALANLRSKELSKELLVSI